MAQITIHIKSSEKDALISLARREYRDPHAQAALLLREALQERGLIQNIQPVPPVKELAQGAQNG